jgi:hypothetical protein
LIPYDILKDCFMFDNRELPLLNQVDSWDKVDQVCSAFFPKLMALKNKTSDLIFTIYKIDADQVYKTYQAPTPSKSRRKGIEFKPERNSPGVGVSFRAKGKPSALYRPNGKLSDMHFAHLGFNIQYFPDGDELGTGSANYAICVFFEPYILKYDKIHRINLRNAAAAHKVDEIILDEYILGEVSASHEAEYIVDLLLNHKLWIAANITDLSNITNTQMASLVITCAAFFPILDIFTCQSNGEKLFESKNETLMPLGHKKYRTQFMHWYSTNATDYIEGFKIEPVTEEEYWKSESVTRSIFETLLGCNFLKTRPDWLKTNKNQKSMELDGFNAVLRLAFEYQGEYHYSYVFPGQDPPEEIQERDLKKLEICKMNDVDLIQISYKFKGDRSYIISKLQELGREDINALLAGNI